MKTPKFGVGVGVVRFSYSKNQAEQCYEFLDHNEFDPCKIFEIVQAQVFPKLKMNQVGMVLRLLTQLVALKEIHGRNFERIWDGYLYSVKDMCCKITPRKLAKK